ncbi:hypothetical protein FA13DRAFT_1713434 [Coprinellus micaceus]|uniref:Uncharacterized protein n=1 Tax=Coprinellus micaceus TaxID=71717 RepID=A0A4Y7SWM1_COPMI|nr:hypothetical protein FA13DRAFT_1713434 [Coprinellus micaceus]
MGWRVFGPAGLGTVVVVRDNEDDSGDDDGEGGGSGLEERWGARMEVDGDLGCATPGGGWWWADCGGAYNDEDDEDDGWRGLGSADGWGLEGGREGAGHLCGVKAEDGVWRGGGVVEGRRVVATWCSCERRCRGCGLDGWERWKGKRGTMTATRALSRSVFLAPPEVASPRLAFSLVASLHRHCVNILDTSLDEIETVSTLQTLRNDNTDGHTSTLGVNHSPRGTLRRRTGPPTCITTSWRRKRGLGGRLGRSESMRRAGQGGHPTTSGGVTYLGLGVVDDVRGDGGGGGRDERKRWRWECEGLWQRRVLDNDNGKGGVEGRVGEGVVYVVDVA